MPEPRRAADDGSDVFERERPRLVGLAYRLLGSLTDAEETITLPGAATGSTAAERSAHAADEVEMPRAEEPEGRQGS